jgi:hypothetical protein
MWVCIFVCVCVCVDQDNRQQLCVQEAADPFGQSVQGQDGGARPDPRKEHNLRLEDIMLEITVMVLEI